MTRNLWQDGIDAPPLTAPRPALDGTRPALDGDTDVAIVGAGFTGLWTAFYLRQLAPGLRVLVIEAAHAGYGASGRNGGWCSAELPAGLAALAARYGRAAAVAMQQAARDAVDEVGKVIADEAIDCGWSKDGSLRLARNPAQRGRLESLLRQERDFGFEDGWRLADPADLAVPRLQAAAFTPHCAVVQPARLARGLAAAAVRHGAEIVEGTRATELTPSAVRTDHGTVRARVIVRATEAYTGSLRGQARRVAALSSQVIATEPIPESAWRQTGWPGRATGTELRILFPYLQRTDDNRLVIGGRSIGYRFGSATAPSGQHDRTTWELLGREIADIFPALADARISHRWSGVLGAYRDFEPRVSYDKSTGLAEAGGYVGDGVALSNLAGRTLAALITGTDRPEAHLCWVAPPVRRWEPEPLRYLAITALAGLARSADAHEQRTGRPAALRGRLVAAAMA